MQKVVVSTDSASDINSEILKKYNIALMYHYVEVQKGRYQKDTDISNEQQKNIISKDKCTVHTIPASVDEYHSFFKSQVLDGQILIHFCVSRKISKSFLYACRASVEIPNVIVIDSGNFSMAMGFLVIEAAKRAYEGETDIKKILEGMNDLKSRTQTTCFVDSLSYLLSTHKLFVQCFAGSKIVHPVFRVMNGELHFRKILFSNSKHKYERFIQQEFKNKKVIETAVLYFSYVGLSEEECMKILEEIKKYVKFQKVYCNEASTVVSCNVGKGSFALAYLNKAE